MSIRQEKDRIKKKNRKMRWKAREKGVFMKKMILLFYIDIGV
jgi:hypothetical protein